MFPPRAKIVYCTIVAGGPVLAFVPSVAYAVGWFKRLRWGIRVCGTVVLILEIAIVVQWANDAVVAVNGVIAVYAYTRTNVPLSSSGCLCMIWAGVLGGVYCVPPQRTMTVVVFWTYFASDACRPLISDIARAVCYCAGACR